MTESRIFEIRLGELTLNYGALTVLDIDDIAIAAGALVVLKGPNGSGKTSLLKVLAGLVQPAHARITVNGAPLSVRDAMALWRGRHIYLHQQPYLFDGTVSANIDYGLRLRGHSRVQRQVAVREALTWARLQHLAERSARDLSTGERQRVALTRAKVLQPGALLVDEIIANMDGDSRVQTRALLQDLSRAGVTVIVASHDAAQFEDIASTAIELDRGRVVRETRRTAEVIELDERQRL